MTDSSLRSISLFFFFAALEERLVVSASQQAVRALRGPMDGASEPDNVRLVRVTSGIWGQIKQQVNRGAVHFLPGPQWSLPKQVSMGAWQEFHKHATEDELPILIWCQILGIPERDVAVGMNLPEGTVRHRLGRALRKLGGMV